MAKELWTRNTQDWCNCKQQHRGKKETLVPDLGREVPQDLDRRYKLKLLPSIRAFGQVPEHIWAQMIQSTKIPSVVTAAHLPDHWPCEWTSGEIPFAFNFYSIGLKRLISIVKKGHSYLERRSCLKFKEYDPREVAKKTNFTYLYYNFSGVLESCCLRFFNNYNGRRLVLITPVCSLPAEVAHAALHGMGVTHRKHEPFTEFTVRAVLFPTHCHNALQKKMLFDKKSN